jgi:hypothetical protein
MITSTDNIDKRMEGILFQDLPKTFKDAVVLTRALGIQYLWIDSLCIIQDSVSDWAAELSQMADVYKHAALTIAASCSTDSYNGFLQKRKYDYNSGSPIYYELPSPIWWDKSRAVLLQP